MPKKQKHTRKRRSSGGSKSGLLAHPYKGAYSPNPALAYTGHGGYSDKMYPSHGAHLDGRNFFLNPLNTQSGGHSGSSYPNGLVGAAYNNPNNLPGVNGIGGDANHYKYNAAPTLQTRVLMDTGANRPFLNGGKSRLKSCRSPLTGGCGTCLKGGKRRSSSKRSKRRRRPFKGGSTSSNTFGQEFINLGRNVPFTLRSAYNGLFGLPPPINPSPLVGQFARPSQRI
jgi:hypothetical protein